MTVFNTTSVQKWDVAISFLIQDIAIAEALYIELSKGLKVFFSPRRQEEIAGTDGMEIFRQTFLVDSRLNVVVYRQRWGTTPWTAVEANAIRDSCVQHQYRNIFVFNIEDTRVFPDWLPHTHMRFDLGEYTLEQVIGAIKLRVAEQGGHYEPITPLKQAQLMKAEQEYQRALAEIRSGHNLPHINTELEVLFKEISAQISTIAQDGTLETECEVNGCQACILRCEGVGMIVRWEQPDMNSLEGSSLIVAHYQGHLRFNRDPQARVHYFQPECVKTIKYDPDLSRSRQYGWKLSVKRAEFVPSHTLAQTCVMQFLDLVMKQRTK